MIREITNRIYVFLLKFLLNFGIDQQNKSVLELIKADLYRCTASTDYNNIFEQILIDPGFRFIFFLRFASIRPKSRLRRKIHSLSYYYHKKYFYKYGYQIPIATKIGKGFQLLHFGNVVFNPACTIGMNCTITQGVLIGQNKRGTPTIGNRVWIGANAVLVGDIIVGSNVLIAPGSFVNKDIPDHSLVIGNPCKIFPKNSELLDGYIGNIVDEQIEK